MIKTSLLLSRVLLTETKVEGEVTQVEGTSLQEPPRETFRCSPGLLFTKKLLDRDN